MSAFDPRGYWEQRLSRHAGREGVGHAGLGEGLNRWMYRVRARVFAQEVASLLPQLPSRRVLDVGSGTGFYLRLWRRLGAGPLAATDIAETAVTRLRARFPDVAVERWALGEPPPPALHGRRFGAISAVDVLFHVLDDEGYERAFAACFALLEEGGALVFTENFLRHGELRVAHQRSREAGRIIATARAAGFEIVRRRPLFWLMNVPVDSRSRLHRAWWRGLAGVAARSDPAGALLGAALYWPELAATRVLRDGPSTELMICRRPGTLRSYGGMESGGD
jgi:SAM-dependent methyltransferase